MTRASRSRSAAQAFLGRNEFEAGALSFVWVSAQNYGDGTITCNIYIDGELAESADVQGNFEICNASVTL